MTEIVGRRHFRDAAVATNSGATLSRWRSPVVQGTAFFLVATLVRYALLLFAELNDANSRFADAAFCVWRGWPCSP
jgi:hypothetical protein